MFNPDLWNTLLPGASCAYLQPQLPVLMLRWVGLHGGKVLHAIQQTGPGGLLLQGVIVPGRVVLTLQQLSLRCRHQHAACCLRASQHHLGEARQMRIKALGRSQNGPAFIKPGLGENINSKNEKRLQKYEFLSSFIKFDSVSSPHFVGRCCPYYWIFL